MKKIAAWAIGVIVLLAGVTFALAATAFTLTESFRISFGIFYLLFCPGFVWTFALFRAKDIDSLERITLSFALSIALVPLSVYGAHLAGVSITALTITAVTLILIVSAALIFLIRNSVLIHQQSNGRT